MKIRSGFVSNSSSSSFILVFDSIPQTKEELKELLNLENLNFFQKYEGKKYTEDEYLTRILKDIQDTTEPSDEELKDDFSTLAYNNKDVKKAWDKAYDRYASVSERCKLEIIANKKQEAVTNKMLNDFKKRYPNKHIRQLTYSDESGGLDSRIEHGNLFKVDHIKISHH